MRWHVIKALTLRSFKGTFIDKGRVSELVIFPLSFLVIWGLFFASGLVERKLAGQMLVVNLIWSISGTFQTQANLTLMFDLWSREFANILRQGVRIWEMVTAHLIFSTLIGLLNLFLFVLFIVYAFEGGRDETIMFFTLFPHYYLSALGLAALFGGFVIYLGRSYGFVAWTGLQLLIMISSPFSPVESLPTWLQTITKMSAFTYIFEYVRFQRSSDYWAALFLGVVYLIVGTFAARILYSRRRANQGLMEV